METASRVTVTASDLTYVGSISIEADILDLADILVNEQVQVVDVDNGAWFETYAIARERGSGAVQVNAAAAARLVHTGDTFIVMSYAEYDEGELEGHRPTVVDLSADDEHRAILPPRVLSEYGTAHRGEYAAHAAYMSRRRPIACQRSSGLYACRGQAAGGEDCADYADPAGPGDH